MNRGLVGIISLLLIAIFVAVLVFRKNSNTETQGGNFYDFIPTNFTEEIIEIKEPSIAIEQLLNSNLVWKDLGTNFNSFETFWMQKDSGFTQIKTSAKYFYFFKKGKEEYYLFKLPYQADSIKFTSTYNSFLHQNFVLFSGSELAGFKKSFEEEKPLGESRYFQKVLNQKTKGSEGVKLYLKRDIHWNIYELNFLSEQVFASGNIARTTSSKSFDGLIDLVILDYLPVQFQTIEISQFDTIDEISKDSIYQENISTKCKCDANYSLYNWMASPHINLTVLNDSTSIFITKIKDFSNFIEGIKDVLPDSLTFESENKIIIDLGTKIRFGTSQNNYQFVLRIDEYVYFAENKLQLEKLNSRIFSGLAINSNDELVGFINNNLNKSSYYIKFNKGISLANITSKNGISLHQESNQTSEFNYSSFIYSKEIEIGKGVVNPKWIQEFSSPLRNAIHKVKNHRTGDFNYAVQDEQNNLYFISPNGDINWKKEVKNPIVGTIKNIDLLGNKKNQLIFNTSNQLYIVDILGRNVGAFPVAIKDTATANVSIIDYDKDLNFRFLIPTTAGIKSINKQGEIVKGWSQPKTKNKVTNDIEHLSISGLDYLFVRDAENKIYLYNRKGDNRHKVNAKFGEPFYLLYGSSIKTTRAIFFDKNENTISKQFFDDKAASILLSPQNRINQFFFIDYNNYKEREFVLVFDNEIVVYGQDLIIQEKIPLPIANRELTMWEDGFAYINELNELTITRKGKKTIIEGVEQYRIDIYDNKNRVLVKQGNALKLLHLR